MTMILQSNQSPRTVNTKNPKSFKISTNPFRQPFLTFTQLMMVQERIDLGEAWSVSECATKPVDRTQVD